MPRHERRSTGFEDKIVVMYARGMTVREFQGLLAEQYGTEVSLEFISSVTDAVMALSVGLGMRREVTSAQIGQATTTNTVLAEECYMARPLGIHHRGGRSPRRPTGLLAALLLGGCASWAPPPFSPSLTSDEACSPSSGQQAGQSFEGVADMEDVIREINEGRRRYIRAAQCLTSDTSAAGAALIGLSSLALFKGITAPHPKDMAGLGVLGGATYLASGGADTGIARRRQLYYAGAAALTCTLRAAEPFRRGRQDGAPLSLLVDAAQEAQADLLAPETRLREHDHTAASDTLPGRRAAEGCGAAPSFCQNPGAIASKRDLELFQSCKAIVARCTPGADTTRPRSTHPAVKAMIANLVKVRDDIDKLMAESAELEARLHDEPGRIGAHVAGIQTKVADEASKTFPDITAVLNSLGGLKSAAFKVSDAAALSEPAVIEPSGKTESAPLAVRTKDLPVETMETARSALSAATRAATRLRHAMQLQQRRFKGVNTDVQSCALTLPGTVAAAPAPAAAPVVPADAASPAPAAQAPVVTADIDPKLLAPLLGLPAAANVEQVQLAVKACQQQMLGQGSATGITIDGETMQALVGGRCKAVAK